MTLFDNNNNEIGKITSGCFSPNLNKSIAIGYIKSEFNTDNPIFCEIRKKLELVKINNLPFVKKIIKKMGAYMSEKNTQKIMNGFQLKMKLPQLVLAIMPKNLLAILYLLNYHQLEIRLKQKMKYASLNL